MFAKKETHKTESGSFSLSGSFKHATFKTPAASFLQRSLGNAAAARRTMYSSSASHLVQFGASPSIQRKCHCGGRCARCAAEVSQGSVSSGLRVGMSHDVYEREADRAAKQVMQMPNQHNKDRKAPQIAMLEIQRMPSTSRTGFDPSPHFKLDRGSGRALSDATRRFMEPRFAADFGHVRVHTGPQAQQSAAQIQAKAFTHGDNIWLGKGASESDKGLMAHELTHVIQQGGQHTPVSRMIQRTQTDTGFESSSGVGTGISNGTMAEDNSIAGNTYTAQNCGAVAGCNIRFEFGKAYKGVYPYAAASGRDVRGVYVKISTTYNRTECGPCKKLHLIQTIRYIKQGTTGAMETDRPTTATRRERAGWDDANAPSRGWMVDRVDSATDPFYTSGPMANAGSSRTPAELWDAPGHWTSVTNHGKEFQTCAVCEKDDGSRSTFACVDWGYYTDNAGNISFRPAAPSASCGATQELQDSAARWDAISGNTATNITF